MVKKEYNSVEFIYCGCGCGFTCPKYDEQRHRLKIYIYKEHMKRHNFLINKRKQESGYVKCACGLCDEWIPKYDKYGRERKYKKNHVCKTKDKRVWIYCACNCGQKLLKYNKYGYERKYIHNHLQVILNKEKSVGWFIDNCGYKHVYKPDHPFADSKGCIVEHRLVWEEYYNCCLLPWIEIHHKNIDNLSQWENKHDNRIENLEPLTKAQHRSLHHKGKPKPKNHKKISSYKSVDGNTVPLEKFFSNVSKK